MDERRCQDRATWCWAHSLLLHQLCAGPYRGKQMNSFWSCTVWALCLSDNPFVYRADEEDKEGKVITGTLAASRSRTHFTNEETDLRAA
jgi:hypothetical protein